MTSFRCEFIRLRTVSRAYAKNRGASHELFRQTTMIQNDYCFRQFIRLVPIVLGLCWGLQSLTADPVRGIVDRNFVTFIFQQVTEANSYPIGSGFFVSVPTKPKPESSTVYFVTARHVLFDTNGNPTPHIYLRINGARTNVNFYLLHVFLTGNGASPVFTNSDKSVDVAVIPMTFDFQNANFAAIPVDHLAARESFKHFSIREGDEMFFLGLFTPFIGSKQNIPVYRFGRLSMLSEEKIPWSKDDAEDLMLMETQVFGGNSGAPCFFYFDERRAPGDAKVILAGIVKGYFQDWSEVRFVETRPSPFSSKPMGISAVIPAYYILEILNCETLQAYRAAVDQAISLGATNIPLPSPAK